MFENLGMFKISKVNLEYMWQTKNEKLDYTCIAHVYILTRIIFTLFYNIKHPTHKIHTVLKYWTPNFKSFLCFSVTSSLLQYY